jgi:hypothetical protein
MSVTVMNLVTHKAGAKHELLLNKQAIFTTLHFLQNGPYNLECLSLANLSNPE